MYPLSFDVPTAYLTAGFLFILVPLAAWLMLKGQGADAPAVWFGGSMALGMGFVLLGLRQSLDPFVSYFVGNSMLVLGNLLHIHALRKELGDRPPWAVVLLLFLMIMAPHEYFRNIAESAYLRFNWTSWWLALLLAWTSGLAWQIVRKEKSKNARWLFGVFSMLTILVITRMVSSLLGFSVPEAVVNGPENILLQIGIVATAVLGNVAILGIYLERASQRALDLAREQVRQQQSSALSQRIADYHHKRSLDEMSSALAHELGQPITGILLDSSIIKARNAKIQIDDAEIQSAIRSLDQHALRARSIIASVRSFAKPVEAKFEHVDLADVVRDVIQLLTFSISKDKVAFEIRGERQNTQVSGSRVLLSLAFLNFFRNAVDANVSKARTNIALQFSSQDDRLEVLIEDDGPGFTPEALARIGEKFFTTKADGMGVGLAMCKRIAQQHGGQLTFENAPTPGGARVRLQLPLPLKGPC
jgi:signal transduction histidine kinase